MLTLAQKIQLAQLLKDNTENFVAPMEVKIDLPVVVGYEDVLDEEGNPTGQQTPIEEIHEFALVSAIITRHDCTSDPKSEYNSYEKISLN